MLRIRQAIVAVCLDQQVGNPLADFGAANFQDRRLRPRRLALRQRGQRAIARQLQALLLDVPVGDLAADLLVADRRRIDFEGYRKAKRQAAEKNRFFCWSGINVFELMHPMCGHEYMLMGMALGSQDMWWRMKSARPPLGHRHHGG